MSVTLTKISNLLALALTCGVVVWRGRRPERIGALVVTIAFLVTPLVEQRRSWYQPQFGIMAVDVATLAALAVMAIRYDRYWPICAAAFQAVAVLTHLAFLINPHALYRAYYVGNFSIGFLLLGAILGGVILESPTPFRVRRWMAPPSGP
jgi:hypothetical protein